MPKKTKKPKAKRRHELDGPIVLSISICDQFIRDERTKKTSLIGLFNTINAHSLPCVHNEMSIYVALTNGHGRQNVEVRIVHLAEQETILALGGPVEFKEPLQVLELNLVCKSITFAAYGVYAVEVYCGDMDVAKITRKFRVNHIKENSQE